MIFVCLFLQTGDDHCHDTREVGRRYEGLEDEKLRQGHRVGGELCFISPVLSESLASMFGSAAPRGPDRAYFMAVSVVVVFVVVLHIPRALARLCVCVREFFGEV